MRVSELLADFRKVGIELRLAADGALACRAPKGAVTAEIGRTIASHKEEIVAFLKLMARDKWSCLVPIQAEGSRPPFFCFHGVGGNVLNYSIFTKYLGPDQPLYGLQAVGLDGLQLPLRDIADMARTYEEGIRSVQPEGPYFLGGGSMGGLVAYEVAGNMLAKGVTVGLLVLFDTIGPKAPPGGLSRSGRVNGIASDLAGKGLLPTLDNLRDKIARKREFRRKMKVCEKCMQAGEALPLEHRLWFIEQLNYQAMARHQIRPYPGEMVLIRGDIVPESPVLSDPLRGWAGVADRVEVHAIAGEHSTLVEQPELGDILARCLKEAQAECLSGGKP